MKTLMILAFSFGVVIACRPAAVAATPPSDTQQSQAGALSQSNHAGGKSDDDNVKMYEHRGAILEKTRRYKDAENAFSEAIAVLMQMRNPNLTRATELMRRKALVQAIDLRFHDSQATLCSAISLLKQSEMTRTDVYVKTLTDLAQVHLLMFKIESAKDEVRSARAVVSELGLSQREHVLVWGMSSEVSRLSGNYDDSIKCANAARDILWLSHERAEDNWDHVFLLLCLGQSYHAIGNAVQAELQFREYQDAIRRLTGGIGSMYGHAYAKMAEFYRDVGRVQEAKTAAEIALRLGSEDTKPDLDRTAFFKEVLGSIYVQTGRLDQAHQLLQSALDGYAKTYSQEHPKYGDTLLWRSDLSRKKHDLTAAEQDLTNAQKILEAVYGVNNPQLRPLLSRRESLARERGRIEEADGFKKRLAALRPAR